MLCKTSELYDIFSAFLRDLGKEILEIQSKVVQVDHKDDGSPFTIADIHSSSEIGKMLTVHFPDIPIVDEEDSNRNNQSEYYFLVDPLDGSKEFINKKKDFTINIALMKNDQPIWGVVYAPSYEELFIGGREIGFEMFKSQSENDSNVSDQGNQVIKMVGSKSHPHPKEKELVSKFEELGYVVEFMSYGSSLKICKLAENLADLYPRFNPTMEWDTAAAQAVLEGAQGKIYFLDNRRELHYKKDGFLNPGFFAFSSYGLKRNLNEVVKNL